MRALGLNLSDKNENTMKIAVIHLEISEAGREIPSASYFHPLILSFAVSQGQIAT